MRTAAEKASSGRDTAPFASVLGRTYAAVLVLGAPLQALLLTPGLMRSRAAWFQGSSWIGIIGFEVLSLVYVLTSVIVSAAVARSDGWTPSTAWAASRRLRRERPRRWWRMAAEAFGWFCASQLVGGYLAWLMPYIWRDASGEGWVLSSPNSATQAVGIYIVICFAAAWFGTRIRHEVVDRP